MKLIACYAENFGCLHQYRREFTDGLQTIRQDNGWGKTTLGVFLKAMFYGLDNSSRKRTDENERKHYCPWQGGAFGGYVIFSVGDKVYRAQRFFGNKEREDTFVLYDETTGLISTDYDARLGEQLFGVDAASFGRTTYFPQQRVNTAMTDQISARVGQTDALEQDMESFEKAMSLLDGQYKVYKKTGQRGRLAKTREEMAYLQQKLMENAGFEAQMRALNDQIEDLKEQEMRIKARLEEANRWRVEALREETRKVSFAHLSQLEEEIARDEQRIKPLREFFKGGVPEAEDIERLIGLEQRRRDLESFPKASALVQTEELLQKERTHLKELRSRLGQALPDEEALSRMDRLAAGYDEVDKKRSKYQEQVKKGRKEVSHLMKLSETVSSGLTFQAMVVLMPALILAAVCVLVAVGLQIYPIVFLLLAIVLLAGDLALFLFFRSKARQKRLHELERRIDKAEELLDQQEAHLEKLEGLKAQCREGLNTLLSEFEVSLSGDPVRDLEGLKRDLSQLQQQEERVYDLNSTREHLIREQESWRQELYEAGELVQEEKLHFEEKYRLNLSVWDFRKLQELRDREREYRLLNEQLTDHLAAREAFHEETGMGRKSSDEDIPVVTDEDIEGMNGELRRVISALEACYRDKDLINSRLEEGEEMKDELARLEASYESDAREAAEISDTMRYLALAKERFAAGYMDKMQEYYRKYMALLAPELKDSMSIDAGLVTRQESGGALYEAGYLSAGISELSGICTRLALLDAMYEEEKPFLILDDPFVNLDDAKVKRAMELLHKLSDHCQIIYLTCHQSRA